MNPADETVSRVDLLALSSEAMITLANVGLFKRATRALESGETPTMRVEPDATVQAIHPDGTKTSVPTGPLSAAVCSCGSDSICRHVLLTVLTYKRQASAQNQVANQLHVGKPKPESAMSGVAPAKSWSPGAFTDEVVEEFLGPRAMASAKRRHRTGYAARVLRPGPGDPTARVELPACTVRFLVPHEIGYAHSNAAPGAGAESIALAIWAFRIADEQAPHADDVQVQVGGKLSAAKADCLRQAVDLVSEVLLDGAVHTGRGRAAAFVALQRELDAARLRWPLLALEELAEQLTHYQERSARYQPSRLAELLTEVQARYRAALADGASPVSRVLGTEEAAQTPLRRSSLMSLGARVGGTDDERVVQVFLADSATGTVFVLARRWAVKPGEQIAGHDLAGRKVGGIRLATLVGSTVVTESAVRSASRHIRLAANRIARTVVMPSGGDWNMLPEGLLVRDFGALDAELEQMPPRLIRPRIDAESVRAMEVGSVERIEYQPGEQLLNATIYDRTGRHATIQARYRSACPAALDQLAQALGGEMGAPRFLSGTVRRHCGAVMVDPIAVVVDNDVVVLDFALGEGSGALVGAAPSYMDPIAATIDDALEVLTEIAHRGARHLGARVPERVCRSARMLSDAGLSRAGRDMMTLAALLGPDPGPAMVTAFTDTHLRLLVTAERW